MEMLSSHCEIRLEVRWMAESSAEQRAADEGRSYLWKDIKIQNDGLSAQSAPR